MGQGEGSSTTKHNTGQGRVEQFKHKEGTVRFPGDAPLLARAPLPASCAALRRCQPAVPRCATPCWARCGVQVEIIRDLPSDAVISCYRCGPMVDLCHGPHVPSTGVLKAVAVNSMSRAFWRADVNKEPLQVRPVLGGGPAATPPALRCSAALAV